MQKLITDFNILWMINVSGAKLIVHSILACMKRINFLKQLSGAQLHNRPKLFDFLLSLYPLFFEQAS